MIGVGLYSSSAVERPWASGITKLVWSGFLAVFLALHRGDELGAGAASQRWQVKRLAVVVQHMMAGGRMVGGVEDGMIVEAHGHDRDYVAE